MTTTYESYLVSRLFSKCMEINESGNTEVFFRLYSHVSSVNIEVFSPSWKESKESRGFCIYYDSELFDYEKFKMVESYLDEILSKGAEK